MRVRWTALVSLALLAGCVSSPQPRQVRPWSQAVADDIPPFGEVEFTLRDGRVERFKDVGDHGDAMCGEFGCVHKADIATAGYSPQKTNVGLSLFMAPLAAPALLGLGVICATSNDAICGKSGKPTGKEPVATTQQIARAWLDGLVVTDGRFMGTTGILNPCIGDAPTSVGRTFATDVEAYSWIVAHRNEVSLRCLEHGFQRAPSLAQALTPEQIRLGWLQIRSTQEVRYLWNMSICAPDPQTAYLRTGVNRRLAPASTSVQAGASGRSDALRVLEETISDPATYAYEDEVVQSCPNGKLPKDQRPDLQAWMAAHSPFAPGPQES